MTGGVIHGSGGGRGSLVMNLDASQNTGSPDDSLYWYNVGKSADPQVARTTTIPNLTQYDLSFDPTTSLQGTGDQKYYDIASSNMRGVDVGNAIGVPTDFVKSLHRPTAAWSAEYWCQIDSGITGFGNLFSTDNQASNQGGVRIRLIGSTGNIAFDLRDTFPGGSTDTTDFGVNPDKGVIANFTITVDGAAGEAKLYKNGVSAGSTGSPGFYDQAGYDGGRTEIGSNTGSSDEVKLYLFRLYNKVLTASEVSDAFDATKARFGIS